MRCLLVAGISLLCAGGLAAADLTGTWIGTIPAQGRVFDRDIEFRLVQDGAAISGKLYGEGPGSPIVEGKVSDGRVLLIIDTREQAGNQINDVRYRFEGEIRDDGEIDVTRERVSARDVVSGVELPVRRPQDDEEADRRRRFRSFRLERLY